jgi:hypothetical protein
MIHLGGREERKGLNDGTPLSSESGGRVSSVEDVSGPGGRRDAKNDARSMQFVLTGRRFFSAAWPRPNNPCRPILGLRRIQVNLLAFWVGPIHVMARAAGIVQRRRLSVRNSR